MDFAASRRACRRAVIELLENRCMLSSYTASLVAPVLARPNVDFNGAVETMVRDPSTGMLFGFDTAGGVAGTGTVYEVNPTTKTLTVITTLQSTGTQFISALLIDSSGNLFGLADFSGSFEAGGGELFELPANNYANPVICYTFEQAFSGSTGDGATPVDMVIDSNNNIDVLTSYGGANNGGTVDQFQPGENYQTPNVLGSMPDSYHVGQSSLGLGANGDIFGVNESGGAGQAGELWELTPQESVATDIASFDSSTGEAAVESFYIDANNDVFGEAGNGVWEYTPSNQQISLIASYASVGENLTGGIIADSAGNLYGATEQGGTGNGGTFFVVNGTTHAISFTSVGSTANGTEPMGAPFADGSGNFYLATSHGAANNAGAVIEISPGSGTGGGGGGGTSGSSSLTPDVTRSTLPASVVGGISKPGTVTVSITNDGSAASKGVGKVQLFASTDGSVDSSSLALGKPKAVAALKAGHSESAPVAVNTETLPAGSYTILAEVTDSTGAVSDSTTGPSLTVAAPFVSLAAALGPVAPATVKLGGVGTFRLTLTNAGNINATGPAIIDVGLSTDGLTVAVPFTPVKRMVTVRSGGKPSVVVLTFKIAKTFSPGGTYEPIITFTQGSTTLTQAGGEFTVA